ncbi:MAG: hypothetical protein ACRCXT_10210 [Paraclostridium sp.]
MLNKDERTGGNVKMKIKIVSGESIYEFEDKLKQFIDGKDIIDIKYEIKQGYAYSSSRASYPLYTALVMYK